MSKASQPEAGSRMGWRRIVLCLGILIMSSVMAIGQLTTGTITGTVTDQTGAAVPGATVTLKNTDTGITRSAQTRENGKYEALSLPTGIYEISLSGFQTVVHTGIGLALGQNAVVNFALQVGEVSQSVTVTGETAQVETTTATVSNLIDEKKVTDLPLNGRDLTQLSFLQPGVIKSPAGAGAFSGLGDKLSVAGSRGNQNIYLLDGVSNSDLSGNAQSASGQLAGAETIKEFQIITNNYSAEYRSQAGAIVSAVTKSGTNNFHGSAYEFLRNDKLDAAKWEENKGGGKSPFRRNQFGGSLGGPIVRDRLHFFVASELQRFTFPAAGPYVGEPADAERIGQRNRGGCDLPDRLSRRSHDRRQAIADQLFDPEPQGLAHQLPFGRPPNTLKPASSAIASISRSPSVSP